MHAFLAHNLAPVLSKQLGTAADIGYIAYFTQSPVCDMNGLVNGRYVAALSAEQRDQRCAAAHSGYVFVSTGQFIEFARYAALQDWSVCGVYDFGNLSVPDRHYLLVRPDLVGPVCRANGFHPLPSSVAFTEFRYR